MTVRPNVSIYVNENLETPGCFMEIRSDDKPLAWVQLRARNIPRIVWLLTYYVTQNWLRRTFGWPKFDADKSLASYWKGRGE